MVFVAPASRRRFDVCPTRTCRQDAGATRTSRRPGRSNCVSQRPRVRRSMPGALAGLVQSRCPCIFAMIAVSIASWSLCVLPVYETSEINPAYLEDASGFRGRAERLFVPGDEQGVAEVLLRATREGIPVTVSGAGTGVTGGRVPQGGWLLSLEKFSRLEIKTGTATAGAGVAASRFAGRSRRRRAILRARSNRNGRVRRRHDRNECQRLAQLPIRRNAAACSGAPRGLGEWRNPARSSRRGRPFSGSFDFGPAQHETRRRL